MKILRILNLLLKFDILILVNLLHFALYNRINNVRPLILHDWNLKIYVATFMPTITETLT